MPLLLSRRRRIALGLVAAVVLLMGAFVTLKHFHLLGDESSAPTFHWIGGASTGSIECNETSVDPASCWNEPTNWQENSVPPDGSNIVIDSNSVSDAGIPSGYSVTLGNVTNSSNSHGIVNNGTVSDITGAFNNNGYYFGIDNYGTITSISGDLNQNSPSSAGIINESSGIITSISATIVNTNEGIGIDNFGTISNLSGTVSNTGDGTGINNESSGMITISSTSTITLSGVETIFENQGTVNGSGTINGIITVETWANIDLSNGLTISGTVTNIGGSITPVYSFDCTSIGKTLGSISDGLDDYAMCVSLPNFDAQIHGGNLDIGSCGIIISYGTYTLTTSLTSSGGDCITVAPNVTGVIIDGANTYTIENAGAGNGIYISVGAEATIQNITVISSGDFYAGIQNNGTITDMSGTVTNSGRMVGILNEGIITKISGTVNNSNVGNGIYNQTLGAVIADISGTINNSSSGFGIYNNGTVGIFSTPIITNTGGGTGFDNNWVVNGAGTLNGDIKLEINSTLDLSGGLTIIGTLTNNGATIYQLQTFDCTSIGKYSGSIFDGTNAYGMCVTSPVTFDAQGGSVYVGSCGTIISSGTYTLNTSLTSPSGSCITVSENVTGVIIDGAYGNSIENTGPSTTDSAISLSSGAEATIQHINVINSADGGSAIYNIGTLTDMSGTVTNIGSGKGIDNEYLSGVSGMAINISGVVDNNGGGHGVFLAPGAHVEEISGTINNNGNGYGVYLWDGSSAINDISGTINNFSAGAGMYGYGTVTINSSATITSGAGTAFDNGGTVNGTGTLNGDITVERGATLDLSSGLTINGTVTNNGGTISCASGDFFNGTACVATLENGQSCTDARQCSSGICNGGTVCIGGATLGQSCIDCFDCDGIAMCGSDYTCGGDGAYCPQTDLYCASPNTCHHNLCTDASKYGSSCDDDDACSLTTGHCDTSTNVCDCAFGNWDGSACAALLNTGDSCTDGTQCASSVCAGGNCFGNAPLGSSCNPGGYDCDPNLSCGSDSICGGAQAYCSDYSQCVNGSCTKNTCDCPSGNYWNGSACVALGTTLYFKNVSGDNAWENPANWFYDAAATRQAISAPWYQDDLYKDFNLALSDDAIANGDSPVIGITRFMGYGFDITGNCNIPNVQNLMGAIAGGTFSGGFTNYYGTIYGGIFSGRVDNYGLIDASGDITDPPDFTNATVTRETGDTITCPGTTTWNVNQCGTSSNSSSSSTSSSSSSSSNSTSSSESSLESHDIQGSPPSSSSSTSSSSSSVSSETSSSSSSSVSTEEPASSSSSARSVNGGSGGGSRGTTGGTNSTTLGTPGKAAVKGSIQNLTSSSSSSSLTTLQKRKQALSASSSSAAAAEAKRRALRLLKREQASSASASSASSAKVK